MVRLAKSSRAIPTSSVIMLLLTSKATIMSTPSDSTSCRRLPILGSSQAMTRKASAMRRRKNFQVGTNMWYPGSTLSICPASASDRITLCLQRRWPNINRVSSAVTIRTGANSMRCRVRLGTSDVAVNHPASTAIQRRSSKNSSSPKTGRREAHVFIPPQI